jgi:hypothetical protein
MTLFGTAEVDWRRRVAEPVLLERSRGDRERDDPDRSLAAESGERPPEAEALRWALRSVPLLL